MPVLQNANKAARSVSKGQAGNTSPIAQARDFPNPQRKQGTGRQYQPDSASKGFPQPAA